MADILVRNVPQPAVDALKRRAAAHRRSLQQELLMIVESAAASEDRSPLEVADTIRRRLKETGRTFGDSTELLHADRER